MPLEYKVYSFLDAGEQGIYTSNGRITTTIADTNGSFGNFTRCTYAGNNSNDFSFFSERVFAVTPSTIELPSRKNGMVALD